MPRKPKKPPPPTIDPTHQWTTRAFAAECGVSAQAVLKVVNCGHMPEKLFTRGVGRNGLPVYGFGRAALEWWRTHRGEKNNVSGHGGRREGTSRVGWQPSAISEEGERTAASQQASGGKGKRKHVGDDRSTTFDQRLRARDLDCDDLFDPETGKLREELLPFANTEGKKHALAIVKIRKLNDEREEKAGTLTSTADVRRQIARMVREASIVLDEMPQRVAAIAGRDLNLSDAHRSSLIGILREDVDRVRGRLSGRSEGEPRAAG